VLGVRDARVRHALHPGGLRGLDDGGVLREPLSDLASGDEEQDVDAGERHGMGRRVGVVDGARRHAECGRLLRRSREGDDVRGGHAAREQFLDDEPAEVSGASGDGVGGHGSEPPAV
jgi:hypothetical protein